MLDKVRLREYRPDDLDKIVRIENECFPPLISYSRDCLRESFQNKNAVCFVAEFDGDVAGFILADTSHNAPDGWISSIDVAPSHRRKGLARRMLLAVEAELKRGGCRGVWLEVGVENYAAINMYESLKYERVGRLRSFYGDGTDAFRFTKRL